MSGYGVMNNSRRKQIRKAIMDLDKIMDELDLQTTDEQTGDEDPRIIGHADKWQKQIVDISSDVDGIHADEEEYLDNMTDSLKDGVKGTTSQEAVDSLESAKEHLEELESCELTEFIAMLHDKYDDIEQHLSNAQG